MGVQAVFQDTLGSRVSNSSQHDPFDANIFFFVALFEHIACFVEVFRRVQADMGAATTISATAASAATSIASIVLLCYEHSKLSGQVRNLSTSQAELGGEGFNDFVLVQNTLAVDLGCVFEVLMGYVEFLNHFCVVGHVGIGLSHVTVGVTVGNRFFFLEEGLEVVPVFVGVRLAIPFLKDSCYVPIL